MEKTKLNQSLRKTIANNEITEDQLERIKEIEKLQNAISYLSLIVIILSKSTILRRIYFYNFTIKIIFLKYMKTKYVSRPGLRSRFQEYKI